MSDGTTTWSYKYNADGLRTEKTDGTTTYKYVYSGRTLVQMTVGDDVLKFYYDGSTPVSLTYKGGTYYYITNLQGDVVAIVNQTGRLLASYSYDAWGNPISINNTMFEGFAELNPLRYRGYVYDQETALYYLQSRYYSPKTDRFINADVYASTGQGVLGHNMFAYCLNNPINLRDESGRLADDWAGWAGEEIGKFFYELFTGREHPSRQTEETERQIRQKQSESFVKGIQKCWNAYVHSIELEAEAQYRQDMAVIEVMEYFVEEPLIAVDAATGVIGFGTGYAGVLATTGVISIPVAGQVVLGVVGLACTVWGIYRVATTIWEDLNEGNA